LGSAVIALLIGAANHTRWRGLRLLTTADKFTATCSVDDSSGRASMSVSVRNASGASIRTSTPSELNRRRVRGLPRFSCRLRRGRFASCFPARRSI
jgi:hypothetical protein